MGIGQASHPTAQYPALNQSNLAKGRLLIVGEESASRRMLHTRLFSLGFEIGEAAGLGEALALCRIIHCDAVLLDVTMAGKIDIENLTALRRLLSRGAILVLGIEDDLECKLRTLEAGADDYLTKPFDMRELTARIRASLRRAVASRAQEPEFTRIGEVSLDPSRRLVQKAGRRIYLTPREFDLLQTLMMKPGAPITHTRLLHTLWGDEYSGKKDCLRTFVRQLRKKLEDDPGRPRYILTESHIGYRFAHPEDWLEDRAKDKRPSGDHPEFLS